METDKLIQKVQLARAKKEFRIQAGADPTVSGWQCFLEEMLIRFEPYFRPGRMITFQNLSPPETGMFEQLTRSGAVPDDVCTVYIPPSVLKTMAAPEGQPARPPAGADTGTASDSGIILASRCRDYDVIVNALLAHAPYHPGIDVYEAGRLLAGYTYASIAECGQQLPSVMHTYLNRSRQPSG